MTHMILLAALLAGSVVTASASDSCVECHGDRLKMEALGSGGFTVTPEETLAQTHMPASCDQCHLGHPDQKERGAAHQGMARLLLVTKNGLTAMSSARRFPLEYGSDPANRVYAVTAKGGKQVRDSSVVTTSWHDKKRDTLSQDFEVMKKTCGACHSREFAEFSKSTMGTNGKQSQYKGWITPECGPHNCGPWFDENLKEIQANTGIPVSLQSSLINQRACNTCHVGCLDCHFNPQLRSAADPTRGPHSFAKTPPAASCYGNGRTSICHAGPEERRRGAGYFGGSFSFPEGSAADVHVKAKVGCLDCHESIKSNPALGHGMVKRQAGDSCRRCHPEAAKTHAASRHRSLSCEACHIQQVAGYQGTYWGPGKMAGSATPFFKYKAYYGFMPESVLIKDQKGRWIPVKPFPMAVLNQKTAPFKPGLHWRFPLDLPDLKRTDDAWGYVGLLGGLPENNKALLWIQMDKLSHKLGKSRSCDSCHASDDGSQLQKVTWEYSDPGALPFSGSHEVLANRNGLFISKLQSEKIEPEPGYALSAFAPWIYLKDAWQIQGDFALPPLRDRQEFGRLRDNPETARKSKLLHDWDRIR
jgi:hypothetical protein